MRLLFALLLAFPVLGAEVTGYVYAVDGSVVEGATVRAGTASTVTGKDGKFVLSELAEGVVELEVSAKGLPTVKPLVLAGDFVSVTLAAVESRPSYPQPGSTGEGTIRGRITLDGKPLANAPVVIGETRVTTNAKGEYVFTGLASERHFVNIDERLFPRIRSPFTGRMYQEGREPNAADLRRSREATLDYALRAAPMVRGRVVDAEGKPVARARVQLVIAGRSTLDFAHELGSPRTAPDGRFAFPAPDWAENENVSVAVTPLLHSTIRSKAFAIGDKDHTIDITLPKLETVRIRVLDRAGKPVAGARVAYATTADTASFESPNHLVDYGVEQRMPRTNAEGEVSVQLAADTYDFAAAAEGFQTGAVTKAIAKPATVDITLERAALLRGRVHRGGRGVAGVSVNLVGGRTRDSNATTDSEGRFELKGMAPGTYRIVFYKQEELIDRTMEVEAPGDVDVSLPPAGTLRGRVIDAATGEPVREFAFSVQSVQSGANSVNRGESTASGTFTLQIPAGTYRVTAGAQNFTSSEPVEARVVENETTTIDIPLGRGATLSGRVTDDSGLPIAGADVTVISASFERSRRAARVGPPQTQTADDGTFTASGIEAGEVRLMVRKQGYVPHLKNVEVSGTMSLDVTLTRGLSLNGIVLRDRRPVPGVQVGASSSAIGGEHQSAITDDDGRFTISGLIPARYTVSAFFEDQHTEVKDVDPAQRRELVLSLDPKPRGAIYGVVTGMPPATGGKYVRRVVMVNSEDTGTEGMIDEAGNYRIENVPVGRMWVTAVVETSTRTTRTSARREVEVTVGQPVRVDLDLAGSVRVIGRVTVDGRPVSAEVGFSSEQGAMGGTRTREDGSYEILLATPGRYHIYARAEQLGDRHFTTVRDIRGGETLDIDLREQTLEGSVMDAVTRQPIAGALVTLTPAATAASGAMMSVSAEVPTDANGRFRIVTTAAGAMRLIVSAPGYAQRVVPVGASPVQYAVELSPVPDLRIRVLDARTGTPLDAYLVFGDANGIVPARPRRSTDGTTYIFSVAPGTYRVTATVQGYTPKTVNVTAPGAVDITME
ncbi:MAG TPA: carboxypeptidase-like regulatory domain-containing protein [Thermoanaerobaculia bacterium]